MASKILIIDDSVDLTFLLKSTLVRDGYEVDVAYDGDEGLRSAYDVRPDLILLDIMMPNLSGLDMLARLREFSSVPVILLTAVDTPESTVKGLDLGADDYMTKPFEMAELKARIRATLRRAALPPAGDKQPLTFDGGRLVIDPHSHHVSLHGQPVNLTPTEYRLLLYLATNAGQVLTAEQILERVWGPGYEDSADIVKVYIRRLRSKIESDPDQPRYLQTRRGIGYSLAKL